MLLKPNPDFFRTQLRRRTGHREIEQCIIVCRNAVAITLKKQLGRRNRDPSVAIHEWVIPNERVHQGSGFCLLAWRWWALRRVGRRFIWRDVELI
jgi:hypothetical protein